MPKVFEKTSSDSDSEEDDTILQQIKESVVSFESLNENSIKNDTIKQKSKRIQDTEDDDSEKVTPQFQEYVAKKLRAKLDDIIEIIELPKKKKNSKSNNNDDHFSIFNFNLSQNQCTNETIDTYQTDLKNTKSIKAHRKLRKKKAKSNELDSEDSSDSNLEMLKEAAVDAKFIIQSSLIKKHIDDFLNEKN